MTTKKTAAKKLTRATVSPRARFEITLWGKCKNESCYEVKATRHATSLVAARLLAKKLLAPHPTIETRSSPERWPWHVDISDRRLKSTVRVDPEYHLVPSVGELGYW